MAYLSFFNPWWPLALAIVITSVSATQTSTYIIHMDNSVMPAVFSDHRSWYTSTLSAVQSTTDDVVAPDVLYVYSNVIHGFSARLSPSQLRQLETSHGFLSSYQDVRVKADTTHTFEFLGLDTNSDGIWAKTGYGAGVIVGVVDTGLWPESASYRDDGMGDIPARWKGVCEPGDDFDPATMCNKKLIGARYFNKGILANNPNASIGINSTRDTDGHGTHTSSTAAGNFVDGAELFGYANGTSRGVAPRAHIAMYKVLWEGDGYASDVIAGMDHAVSDGVDVISISLGFDDFPLHRDPVAIAAFAAMEKGIFVSSSTGNVGPSLGTLHNGIPWTLTVGASTVDRIFSGIVELGDGTVITGTSIYIGKTLPPKELPLVPPVSCTNGTLLKEIGRNRLVVCEKSKQLGGSIISVNLAELTGVVFITDDIFLELYEVFSFPGVILNPREGEILIDYINKSLNPTATLKFHITTLGTKPAPMVAAYSSRGPSPSCPSVLKPDIVAPGTLILASWPPKSSIATIGFQPVYNPFNIISGSSMACPHAAGVAALLKAAHPDWTPAAIRSAIMTTADIVDNTGNPIKDTSDRAGANPLAMGAGHVNPNKAIDPGLIYDAGVNDYIRLLCSLNYTQKQIISITRSPNPNCSNSSLDLNYPSFIAFFNQTNVTEFHRTVTNVADGEWSYKAEITAMGGVNVTVTPDRLVFSGKDEKLSFVVRVAGGVDHGRSVHGSITWVDEKGKYVVRSPIVATTLSSQPL